VLGTSIDEPVVQVTSDQPNRYLYAYVFGGSGYGASYIECDCSLDGPFAIVYGHYMSDGQRVLRDLGRVPPPGEYKPVSR